MRTSDIPSLRLAAQSIAGAPKKATPARVVAGLAAIQGQDVPSSLWAIGLRVPGSTSDTVAAAVSSKRIVRSWVQRGTLHWVAAEDLRWMLALAAPRMLREAVGREGRMGLDVKTVDRARALLLKALGKGVQTRESLMLGLDRAGIATQDLRGYHLLWRFAYEGLICCAAPQGKAQTFALLENWLPSVKSRGREAALTDLARRYFSSRGPAGLEDYERWSGLTLKEARLGLELAKPHLVEDRVEGKPVWLSRSSVAAPQKPPLYLLPGYDEYLLGYRYRDAVLAPEHAVKICPGGNGIFRPMIVFQGRIIGTWKPTLKKGLIEALAAPFDAWPKGAEAAFSAAAETYAKFWV